MKYSEKEEKLIRYFNVADAANSKTVGANTIYNMMVMEAFLRDDRTEYAESLRRCVRALNSPSEQIYRMTPEWDNLITV